MKPRGDLGSAGAGAPPPGPPGRPAGRESPWRRYLRAGILPRVAVILIAVPCLIVITLRGGLHFLLLVDLILLLGMREFYAMMKAKGYRPYTWLGILCGLALSLHVYRGGLSIALLLTLTLMLVMIIELFRRETAHALNHIAITVMGVLYVAWLGSHLILLREARGVAGAGDDLGARLVFLVAAITWVGDTASYLVGIAVGRRPLLPRVSPAKTVEGAVGGLLGSAGAGVLCAATFAPFLTLPGAAMLGVAGGACGQLGDLVESLLKRSVGIKDSAGLIPGHGGVLDRFDSLLFSAPLLYYYLRFFVI